LKKEGVSISSGDFLVSMQSFIRISEPAAVLATSEIESGLNNLYLSEGRQVPVELQPTRGSASRDRILSVLRTDDMYLVIQLCLSTNITGFKGKRGV
jgi:hypothetical protein